MPKETLLKSCAVFIAVGLAISSTPARAGFEWVAPGAPTNTYPAPAPVASYHIAPPAPAQATSLPEIISPVIISGTPPAPTPPPAPFISPAQPMAPAPQATEQKLTFTNTPLSIAPSPAPMAQPAGDIVQGFASQIPLTLALRQVLPASTTYSIDRGIGADILVSYKGGESWRDTLHEMLAPTGLAAREQGSNVVISRVISAPIVAENPPPQAQPQLQPQVIHPSPVTFLTPPLAREETQGMNVGMAEGWSAERGDTLRKVLTAWCKRANIELQWKAEYDYPIEGSAHFSSSFEDAVRNLLAGFSAAHPQPVGELHNNSSAGQKVLVIQARGNSYTE